MATDVEICSTALLLVGAEEINAFEDETREARICSYLYKSTRDALLQTGTTWRFSIGQAELNKLTAVPLFGFNNAFQLPANYLKLVGKDNPALKHRIFEDKLYSDANAIKVNYQFSPSETKFPAYFEKALYLDLAVIFAIAVTEDAAKSQMYEGLAKTALLKARTVDSQSHGDHEMPDSKFKLTAIRL